MEEPQLPWYISMPINKSVIIALSIVYCIAPPYLTFYQIDAVFFKEVDFLKLILMSSAIGVMIFALNYFLIYAWQAITEIKTQIRIHPQRRNQDEINLHEDSAQYILGVYSFFFLIFLVQCLWQNKIQLILPQIRYGEAGFLIFIIFMIFLDSYKCIMGYKRLAKEFKEKVSAAKIQIEELDDKKRELIKERTKIIFGSEDDVKLSKINNNIEMIDIEIAKIRAEIRTADKNRLL